MVPLSSPRLRPLREEAAPFVCIPAVFFFPRDSRESSREKEDEREEERQKIETRGIEKEERRRKLEDSRTKLTLAPSPLGAGDELGETQPTKTVYQEPQSVHDNNFHEYIV